MKAKTKIFLAIIFFIIAIFTMAQNSFAYDAITDEGTTDYTINVISVLKYITIDNKDYICTRKTIQANGEGQEYIAYCLDHSLGTPRGSGYYYIGTLNNESKNCLIYGFPNEHFTGDDDKDYYITNVALHILNKDRFYNGALTNEESIKIENGNCNDPHGLRGYILQLVDRCKNGDKTEIKLGNVNQITKIGDNYITNKINVSSSITMTDYDVNTEYDVIEKDRDGFKFSIPSNKIKNGEVKISATANFSGGEVAIIGGDNNLQEVIVLKNALRTSDEISFNIGSPNVKVYKQGYNAKGELVRLAGVEISIFQNDTLIKRGITDNRGFINFGNLPDGKYCAKETKTLDGYVIDPKEQSFEITHSLGTTQNDIVLKFINERKTGTIKIIKTSSDSEVENFTFRIFGTSNLGDEVDLEFITNSEGIIIAENIFEGTYSVTEVLDERSAQYIRPNDLLVEVKYNETSEVNVFNEKIVIPKTGEDENNVIKICIEVITLLFISFYLIYVIKKNKKKTS